MKKVKFLKDHVNGIKKGQTGEFNIRRADYLIRVGVAEYVEDKPKAQPKKAVKQTKAKAKTAVKVNEPCKTC